MGEKKEFLLKYTFDEHYLPTWLQQLFLPLPYDEETEQFFHSMEEMSLFERLTNIFIKPCFLCIYGVTEANAFLGLGHMHILGKKQIATILSHTKLGDNFSHLDIGSGDGNVTEKFKTFVSDQFCVEISLGMLMRLKEKGFKAVNDLEKVKQEKFDLITCLNLLDRCTSPMTMLEDIKERMTQDSIVILTIPLPLYQYVESGKVKETLIQEGLDWNDSVVQLANKFEKCGFSIVALSRVPYISQGDVVQDYYVLDTVLFVLKLKIKGESKKSDE